MIIGGKTTRAARTVLIYSGSGEGKTAQLGEIALDVYKRTGKKSLLATIDDGGYETIRHIVDLDVIDVLELADRPDVWEWCQLPSQGFAGLVDPKAYGALLVDGASGLGNALLADLRSKAAAGKNISGQKPSITFKEGDRTVVNNAPAHFGLVQAQIRDSVHDSFRFPWDTVAWTALSRGGDDETTETRVVGPSIAGKQLTNEIAAAFMYTFRLVTMPANPALGTTGSTRLYLAGHADNVAAGAKGIANGRFPMGERPENDYLEPANVVEAMRLVGEAREKAGNRLRSELGL